MKVTVDILLVDLLIDGTFPAHFNGAVASLAGRMGRPAFAERIGDMKEVLEYWEGILASIVSSRGGADSGGEPAPENARRIVACVNACKDIPTEALEAGVIGDVMAGGKVMLAYYEYLRLERSLNADENTNYRIWVKALAKLKPCELPEPTEEE